MRASCYVLRPIVYTAVSLYKPINSVSCTATDAFINGQRTKENAEQHLVKRLWLKGDVPDPEQSF